MMNEITTQTGTADWDAPELPELSPRLAALARNHFRAYSIDGSEFTPDDFECAFEALKFYSALATDWVTPARVAAWLIPLNALVRNPMPRDGIGSFAVALVGLFPTLPAAAFNRETQREAARNWQFFPAAADVLSIIEPIDQKWDRTRRGLCSVIARA